MKFGGGMDSVPELPPLTLTGAGSEAWWHSLQCKGEPLMWDIRRKEPAALVPELP